MQNLKTNIKLDNKFFSGSPINITVCNENDKIELSKIKLSNNIDCRLNMCYNNIFDCNNKINILNYSSNYRIKSLLNDSCDINYLDINEEINDNNFDDILEKIEIIFTLKEYDTSEIENGKDDMIKYKNMTVTLTSTKNQKNEEKKGNVTTINLGECERLLKDVYNIYDNETLFIKK